MPGVFPSLPKGSSVVADEELSVLLVTTELTVRYGMGLQVRSSVALLVTTELTVRYGMGLQVRSSVLFW